MIVNEIQAQSGNETPSNQVHDGSELIEIDYSQALQFCNTKCEEMFEITTSSNPVEILDLTKTNEMLNEKKFIHTKLT